MYDSSVVLQRLHAMRERAGARRVSGLRDAEVARFADLHSDLGLAVEQAARAFEDALRTHPEIVAAPEEEAIRRLQAGYLSFYAPDAASPYVLLAARGPWLVSLHGAVIHEDGGYGMLGFGHAPAAVMEALAAPWPMANIMTAQLSQPRLQAALRREIGRARVGGCPFDRFVCMNSGSESMSVAARIVDLHTHRQVGPGGPRAGQRPVVLGLERAFHGRTYGPASWSHSTWETYAKHLQSFQGRDSLWTVPANDVDALSRAFERAAREGVFLQVVVFEPVQGEGAPGQAITREFYDRARTLTLEHGSLLVADSIQAGLRAYGVLSMVDYPGFEDALPPDMESWSKALNAGQYPISVLGLMERAAAGYVTGVYGNTMTTNPRGLEVASAVLGLVDDAVRENIRRQGHAFLADLHALQRELPHLVTEVRGTGLLFCAELDPALAEVCGVDQVEDQCRRRGVNVIHGGRNALRFTPHFRITDAERELVIAVVREVLLELTGH